MQDIVNVAVVNFQVNAGNKKSNLKRVLEFSSAAAKRGADIILFPELCLTGYDYYIDENISMEDKISMSETTQGPSCKAVAGVSTDHNVYIIFGMGEKYDDDSSKIYNSAIVIGPEGVIGAYQKIHPFVDENRYFTKGERPFLFDSPWGPISLGICYDTFQFPELMRYCIAKGARLHLNPTAFIEEVGLSGSRAGFLSHYKTTLDYAVLCNTIFLASANLTGYDNKNYFAGASVIMGPKVTPLYETDVVYYAGGMDNTQNGIVIETLDLSMAQRRLFVNNSITGTPDYRLELYKTFK